MLRFFDLDNHSFSFAFRDFSQDNPCKVCTVWTTFRWSEASVTRGKADSLAYARVERLLGILPRPLPSEMKDLLLTTIRLFLQCQNLALTGPILRVQSRLDLCSDCFSSWSKNTFNFTTGNGTGNSSYHVRRHLTIAQVPQG